ncbi:hypothetical protein A2U01_0014422 [Trifolium medium]|uniref:Uncharacterized protein n=1 Tax=Trifolium medium TaxID=97028 RepID=A0A392N156_9FABA|nr:hypothetical protein [Trifolium medium]
MRREPSKPDLCADPSFYSRKTRAVAQFYPSSSVECMGRFYSRWDFISLGNL